MSSSLSLSFLTQQTSLSHFPSCKRISRTKCWCYLNADVVIAFVWFLFSFPLYNFGVVSFSLRLPNNSAFSTWIFCQGYINPSIMDNVLPVFSVYYFSARFPILGPCHYPLLTLSLMKVSPYYLFSLVVPLQATYVNTLYSRPLVFMVKKSIASKFSPQRKKKNNIKKLTSIVVPLYAVSLTKNGVPTTRGKGGLVTSTLCPNAPLTMSLTVNCLANHQLVWMGIFWADPLCISTINLT